MRLLRPSAVLGRAFGFVGRVVLKIGVPRWIMLAMVGITVAILVAIILTLASLGG